ncbi:torsin-1A-interacting protein 2-like isoform X10 [Siniperca chuatsi]|uniref:torsin-1A-interacting protein 2-like isoform X10 n=1 Tax=Siniperca chuatsi TaxID=119488 RepID=UPI001CE0ED63|nr:torsin-1A-interacting protein 2-like isoform X10 [Siniperca chuatsi]
MEQHDAYQHKNVKGEETQEETDIALNVKEHHPEDSASSSASTSRETKTNNGEDKEQTDVKNSELAEKKKASSPDEASMQNVEGNSTPPQADDGSHGDNRETQRNEQLTKTGQEISREYHTGESKALETTTPPNPGDRKGDQVDGPKARHGAETPGTNNINTVASDDDGRGLVKVSDSEEEKDIQEKPTSPQIAVPQQISVEEERDQQTDNVETIGPTTEETTEPIVPVGTGIFGERKIYLMGIGIVLVLAILVQYLLQPESPPQKNDTQQIEIFLRQMEKVKTQFPNQRAELWIRSKIHLLRHLRAAQPTEPVSLILTAGLKAEKTLHCLAQSLASAFSSALNASVLHIDGASKASQDSDEVKLDIDNQLQGAFEGDKPVAVIHRFEELPPGSTLIFYRYCDHENAAYKKTCLMFTVLLGEEEEIPANSHLSIVEEMVDDHLQKKFLSGDHPISFDRMDLNKYGGLWSRISHLILPVAAEERIEHEGC